MTSLQELNYVISINGIGFATNSSNTGSYLGAIIFRKFLSKAASK